MTSEIPQEIPAEELANQAQALEGYLCSCGQKEIDVNKFKKHMLITAKDRSNHESMGRINFDTGEIIMPPAKHRTKEQWRIAKYGNKPETVPVGKGGRTPTQIKPAEILAQATSLRLIPRIYTIDYSPIMRSAHQAVHELWGWPTDMTLGEILDTILHTFFKDRGVTLGGYIIEETPEQKEHRLSILAAKDNGSAKVKPAEVKEAEVKEEVAA